MVKNKYLIVAILFQALVLVYMLADTFYPLIVGTEINMRIRAKDPRSMMRGNYVALNYNFSNLNLKDFNNNLKAEKSYRFGDEVFLVLSEKNNFWVPISIHDSKPTSLDEGEKLLKAMINQAYFRDGASVKLSSGIESFFMPHDLALELENEFRGGQEYEYYAKVMLTESGKARIKEIAKTELSP